MKNKILKGLLLGSVLVSMLACNTKKEEEKPVVVVDKEQIKKEIQAKEDEFAAVYNSGEIKSIDSSMLNSYIKEASRSDFTAKDFRTWAGSLQMMRSLKVLEKTDAQNLREAYIFLRRCESVLRRWQFRSISTLPVTHEEEERFARRMKFATIEDFRAPYGRARELVHSLRMRYLAE